MKMLVKLENPSVLSKVVEIISDIVTEVRIRVDENGLRISAIDPANVSMLGFKIPRTAFSQFEVDSEILGVNLDNLKQILKRCNAGSVLVLEKKENTLAIQIQDRIRRNFTLSLIDVEGEEIDFDSKLERMNFSSAIEIRSVDLIASIEDCAVVADACSFIINENKFIIEAKSLNSAMSEFSGDEAKITGENCRAKYSLEYLQKFLKGAKLCDKTELKFAEDHPLKIDFKTPVMELGFVLAPRVETED
jgi:proliferating cell nuclear antigen